MCGHGSQESNQRFDKEDGFKARAHNEVVKLQAGDKTNVSMWQRICDISAEMFGEVYGRLGIDKYVIVVVFEMVAVSPFLSRACARFLVLTFVMCVFVSRRLMLRGESFYNTMLASVISELESKGLLTDSDGASVMWTNPTDKDSGKPPLMVRKCAATTPCCFA